MEMILIAWGGFCKLSFYAGGRLHPGLCEVKVPSDLVNRKDPYYWAWLLPFVQNRAGPHFNVKPLLFLAEMIHIYLRGSLGLRRAAVRLGNPSENTDARENGP